MAVFVLAAIATAIIGLPITHYGDKLFGDEGPSTPEKPAIRIDAEASLVNPIGHETGAEEYVCLVNDGDSAVDLTGWKLYDSVGKVNELSRFWLPPQGSVRVHPGGRSDHADTGRDLYGGDDSPRWTNSGDTITLRNPDDERVDVQSFPARGEGEASGTCEPSRPVHSSRHDRDCASFRTQREAQAFFLAHGGPARDPYELDGDGDGIACESIS